MSERSHPHPRSGAGVRRVVPVRVYRLGEEPADELSASTTPEERVALVWELTARAWALTSKPVPAYERRAMPIVVRRRG